MNFWFLIQYKPNSHRLAEQNLNRQDFETFLPLQKITKRQASRFVSDLRPLFPGYMFVNADPEQRPWNKINSTRGVSRLITFSNKPIPLPNQLVPELISQCDAKGVLQPMKKLDIGNRVKIKTGPFAKFIATLSPLSQTNAFGC